jgi:hypothetical protein
MDTLKLKKEDRVKKEDAYMVLATKAAKEALSTDETAQLKTLETEISGLDSEIETLEKAEVRAKEIAKRQSANVITSKKASGEV